MHLISSSATSFLSPDLSDIETRGIILPQEQKSKSLIRLQMDKLLYMDKAGFIMSQYELCSEKICLQGFLTGRSKSVHVAIESRWILVILDYEIRYIGRQRKTKALISPQDRAADPCLLICAFLFVCFWHIQIADFS